MNERRHSMETVFPILLFCIFTFCAISVVLFAARIYQHSVETASENYSTGTALSYLSEKIRRSDTEGAASAGTFDGMDALILSGSGDSADYETCIYLDDGTLRELYRKKGADIDPAAGSAIMELKDFSVRNVTDHLLNLTVTDTSGNTRSRLIAVRSGKTAA